MGDLMWHFYRVCVKQLKRRFVAPKCLRCGRTDPAGRVTPSGSDTLPDFMMCTVCEPPEKRQRGIELFQVHRMYTEDVNREGIIEILDKYFTAYNVTETLGRWKGLGEKSLMIEVTGTDLESVHDAAREIKEVNKQEAVLISAHAPEMTSMVRDVFEENPGVPSKLAKYP